LLPPAPPPPPVTPRRAALPVSAAADDEQAPLSSWSSLLGSIASAADSAGRQIVPAVTAAPDAAARPQGLLRAVAFDPAGHPVRWQGPKGLVYEAAFDDFGRLVSYHSPEASGPVTYRYDEASRLIEKRDPGGVVSRFDYDALGRLLSKRVIYPDPVSGGLKEEETARLRYEAAHLVEVRDRNQTTRYRYDAAGRLVEESIEIHLGEKPAAAAAGRPPRFTTRYHYDKQGRLIAKTLPGDLRLDLAPDGTVRYRGRPLIGEVDFIRFGQNTERFAGATLLGRIRLQADYDASGTLTDWGAYLLPPEPEAADPLAPARTLLHLRYRTDPKGRIVAISRYEETAKPSTSHQGEGEARITTTRYRYDEAGRRLEKEETTLASPGGQAKTPPSPKTATQLYRYDAQGRRRAGWIAR
jgi:YD repeat-containing protein